MLTLTEISARGIDGLDPVYVLFVILNRVHRVERERAKERSALDCVAHLGHGGRHLVSQQVTAQSRLGALCIFEFHDRRTLNRLFAHAKESGRHLGDDPIRVRHQWLRIAALAGARKCVQSFGGDGTRQHDV